MASETRLSWAEFTRLTAELAEMLSRDGGRPDFLVGIARGGLPLLTALASYFSVSDVGVAFVRSTVTDEPFSSRLPTVQCHGLALPGGIDGRSVVVADDIIRSGRTVRAVLDELAGRGQSTVRVVSLYAEHDRVAFSYRSVRPVGPDQWVLFPWDDWANAT